MVLFENYYYNVFTFANKVVKQLRAAIANGEYSFTHAGSLIINKVQVDEYTIELYLIKQGLGDDLAELVIDPDDYKVQLVDVGGGVMRSRKLPVTKIAKINVYIYNQLKKFELLKKIVINNIKAKNAEPTFEEICKAFAQTQYFSRTIAHELQHFLKPRLTKLEPRHRRHPVAPHIERQRRAGRIDLTKKELQKYISYLLSDDEVDSAIAEATAYVFEQSDLDHFFKQNKPSVFVRPCLEHLRASYKWVYYSQKIRDRIRKRIERLYYLLRKKYYVIQQENLTTPAASA
jgi:hypothetical protein